MWYTTTFLDRPALMFYDGNYRSIHFEDDSTNPQHALFLEWVAAGNTPEPWQPDAE